MRISILFSVFLILVAGCVLHHEEGTGQRKTAGPRPADAPAVDVDDTPAVAEDVTDPADQSELLVDEEGRAQWKEIPLPQDWPEDIPLVEDARIVYRERAVHKPTEPNNVVMESQIPVDEAGAFYLHYFTGLGWKRLDMSRGPQLYNCTFLDEDHIVDVNIRHVPEDVPGMEGVEAVGETTEFEGTVIKLNIMPVGDLSYFKGAVAWYSLDDVPPGYPLDEVPRFEGGIVDLASFAPGDHVVMQQHIPGVELKDIVDFYRDYYLGRGLEVQVNEDAEDTYGAEFYGEGYFVRVTVTQYDDSEMTYCDIYKQITATE